MKETTPFEGAPSNNAGESKESTKIISFETARGSVYTYSPEGKIERFKKTTGETFTQDVVVFIPDWNWFRENASKEFLEKMESGGEFEQKMLEYVQDKEGNLKAWIIDKEGNKIDSADDLLKVDKIFLYFGTYEKSDFIIPVSKKPQINFLPFDTTKYQENEEWKRQSHIGNKIVKINHSN